MDFYDFTTAGLSSLGLFSWRRMNSQFRIWNLSIFNGQILFVGFSGDVGFKNGLRIEGHVADAALHRLSLKLNEIVANKVISRYLHSKKTFEQIHFCLRPSTFRQIITWGVLAVLRPRTHWLSNYLCYKILQKIKYFEFPYRLLHYSSKYSFEKCTYKTSYAVLLCLQ